MPRIRSIHPDTCDSEKMSSLSDSAERTFFRLLTHSDDEGRGEDRPKLLAAKLYPLHDGKDAGTVDADLDEIQRVGLLVRYRVDGRAYYAIPTFEDWQKPRHPSPSKYPGPDQADPELPDTDEHVTDTLGSVTADRGKPHAGVGGVSGEGGGEVPPPGGNGEPFERRLADELREQHGCSFEPHDTLHGAFQDLLSQALERLPPDRHHGTAMGLIARFVERTTLKPMTSPARSHTARLVNNHRPSVVLDAFGEAMNWGAGTTPEYADDPTALSKYVAGVLSAGKRGAA